MQTNVLKHIVIINCIGYNKSCIKKREATDKEYVSERKYNNNYYYVNNQFAWFCSRSSR